ncbi:protein kinase [Streptomyces sp. IB2014 016-6]|uniref:protein kinase domain-containing protein n=1 Tax=Streptomyces sp. IB2014 016-6 TaxID=2517818 RepID=UPI0011C9B5F2|nr:protein kinase [Streptomyces sp. IB2014 016-6]TXL91450.1 serine/threonine protein kinase [Streptomyces sp. IB2014 016-6]
MEKLAAGDPQRIGAYRLLARLGAGGMGQVYLARSDRGRTVAVKLVRKELAEQDEFRNRFRLEVAAARRVGGAWTAPVLDANTEAAVPWVATGYVAGPALQDIVSGTRGPSPDGPGPHGSGAHGPLPARSVRILGSGLAHALQDIHSAGLIHRDLKPSNVLITIEGPRVIDFGIARAMETVTGAGLTRTGGLVGSPGFMAPEQVRGTPITPACDVFCLGSVLAYAATGRLPFGTADTAVHVLMFRIAQEEPDLSELPEGLRELVGDCLKKDPEERPTPAQILARVGEPDDDEPWLPGALLAQLGSHAVQLLDHEEPGARTELAFSKPPEPPSEASVPKPPPLAPSARPAPGPAGGRAPGPASEPAPDPASIPPPPGGPGQGGGNGVHGMATMIGAGSPDVGPPPAPQPPQPQAYGYPQSPQSPQSPQPQLPPPPQQYGYPQPGQPPLPPWGATPPYGPPPAGYGHPSPYGPTPPYGPAAPAPQPEPRRSARGTVALIAVALVVALGAGGSVYAFMDSGSEKDEASDSQADRTADDKSSQAGDAPSEDAPPATKSPSPSASDDAGPGDVPKKYLGSWSGTIGGAAGVSTRELSIRQGEVGETVLELTAEGPTDTGGTYLCVFEAALGGAPGSSDGPLRIGPSEVTEGRPMSSCTPGAATELTILPDGRLRRVTTSDGESVTYTKND